MKIKFLGAASGIVTGSSYILTSDSGSSVLIDLGMFQGVEKIEKLNYEPYNYDPSKLSGAILTHAHLDHCGRLPIILPRGFNKNIYMTAPTRDLTELSLFDTAKIAKNSDNKILFNEKLVEKTVKLFQVVNYHEEFQVGDFKVIMYDAGHILGSTSLEITDTKSNNEIKKIIFSGDLGNSPEPLQKPTEILNSADLVVMESTYGDRLHPKDNPANAVQSEINEIEEKGGTLLIPAFSLERTQELLHLIKHLKIDGKIKVNTPIYLDSPMAQKATDIYTNYFEYFNDHIKDDLKSGSPFEFEALNIIDDGKQSEELDNDKSTKVIIAGSGMMTGGRIVGHAASYLKNESTRLLIVGYQGEETLGRDLLERKQIININGVNIDVKAHITDMQSMSSHADQSQLINWLKNIQNVKKVYLTHGEDRSRTALKNKITEELGIKNISMPVLGEEL